MYCSSGIELQGILYENIQQKQMKDQRVESIEKLRKRLFLLRFSLYYPIRLLLHYFFAPSFILQQNPFNPFQNQLATSPTLLTPLPNYYIFKSEKTMHSHQTLYSNDPSRSRTKHRETTNTNKDIHEHNQQQDNIQQLRLENSKLKKMLKDAQAKRTQITKECSHLTKSIERVQTENQELRNRLQEQQEKVDGEKYRWEELKFLNKQLASEIEELRTQNQSLVQKLRYSSQVLQRKYEQLQEKSYKRMDQCVKRIKKGIHYLQTLSTKQIDKTRDMLTENLRKSIELLRGKYNEQLTCEGEIQELMNPLKTMQEEITLKTKEANTYRQENMRLSEEIAKYKTMEKEQIPMFKQAIEKLKKNLVQVRSQLSENQYQKMQVKKKYEVRLRETQYKYNELFKECRKIKLEKKIYENKLAELEADVEEEKERLIGENQMLKKLYNNQDSSESRISQASNPPYAFKQKKTQEKRVIKKNFSKNQLKTSNMRHSHSISDYQPEPQEISQYNQQSSMLSQQNLKQEIIKIDEEIMEIQKNLTKELEAYR